MDVVDDLARTLGHRYGEVQELCPPEPPETYCVYRDGQRAGVNATLFQAEGNPYIRRDFGEMFRLRIRSSRVHVEHRGYY